MGWFSSETTKVVDSVGGTVDELFTSDEERLKAKGMLEDIKVKSKDIDHKLEEEITKRWELDSRDGWLTKNVRPLSYVFVLAIFGTMFLGYINPKDSYLPIIETLLVTMTVALFGSRGIEKTAKAFKSKK